MFCVFYSSALKVFPLAKALAKYFYVMLDIHAYKTSIQIKHLLIICHQFILRAPTLGCGSAFTVSLEGCDLEVYEHWPIY